jgi:hypothetical protein
MKLKKFRYWSDETKANLIRFWGVGAVCFFIAWGTPFGASSLPIDLIFFLAVGIAVANIVVINPVIRGMLHTTLDRNYMDTTVMEKVWSRLKEFFQSLFIVIIIFITYQVINIGIIAIFNVSSNTVPLPTEPILFGIFYVIYYTLIRKLFENIKSKLDR